MAGCGALHRPCHLVSPFNPLGLGRSSSGCCKLQGNTPEPWISACLALLKRREWPVSRLPELEGQLVVWLAMHAPGALLQWVCRGSLVVCVKTTLSSRLGDSLALVFAGRGRFSRAHGNASSGANRTRLRLLAVDTLSARQCRVRSVRRARSVELWQTRRPP